ncbi:MAG: hypothetical protein IJ459_02040 [Clostridia bacterium]|nr:hypothetical protein [Clostridia bacterium]
MKISVIGKAIAIRELGVSENGLLRVEIWGVPEGTEVMLRAPGGEYAVGTVKDGAAVFSDEILSLGGDFRLSLKNSDGEELYVGFTHKDGAFLRRYKGVSEELTTVYEALMFIAERQAELYEKVTTLTDGWQTE